MVDLGFHTRAPPSDRYCLLPHTRMRTLIRCPELHALIRGCGFHDHTGEVDLLHAGVDEHLEASLRILDRQDEGGFRRVEAKAARVVTLPSEVVIDAQRNHRTCFC